MQETTPTATPVLVRCADTTTPLTTILCVITHPPIILGPAVPTMSIAVPAASISVPEQATARPTQSGPDAIGTNKHGRIHPATKVFQAIRIEVNDELGQIERTLPMIPKLLNAGFWYKPWLLLLRSMGILQLVSPSSLLFL